MQKREIRSRRQALRRLTRPLGMVALALLGLGMAGCGGGGGGGGMRLVDVNGDGQIVILAFGDSITRGVGDGTSDRSTPALVIAGYPARLGATLGLTVRNAGQPGERAVNGVPRLNDTLRESPDVDYVILLEGINDLSNDEPPENVLGSLRAMINVVLGMGRIPVIGTLVPICCQESFVIDPAEVAFVSEGIRGLGAELQIDVIDFFEGFGGVFYDPASGQLHVPEGLHPTPFGYDVMAELAADVFG